jgi:hypothetical protein
MAGVSFCGNLQPGGTTGGGFCDTSDVLHLMWLVEAQKWLLAWWPVSAL